MSIERHPDVSTLLTCAAGSQPEALCAVVASHISICSRCFKDLRAMEGIGQALFDDLTADVLRARIPTPPIDEPPPGAVDQLRTAEYNTEIPRTLRHILGSNFNDLPWQEVAPGIEQHIIPLSPGAKGDLRVLKLADGAQIPEHGHCGEELSLVLLGSCRDAGGDYTIGDFIDLDDETRHEVIVDDNIGCILIVASETEPEFVKAWSPTT